ncbi:MAG TPA: hypothetical protein VLA56_20630 [Pseudomonadales bacterium]|nr:hypothetical protein [Pseudomonadales bacterium]
MRLIVVLGLIAVVGWALLRSQREQRRAWLQRLALPGTWSGEQDGRTYQLVLDGDLAGGRYRERTRSAAGQVEEVGRWSLSGHVLRFEPDRGNGSECDLRLFEPGRIGIHGPGRERRVYERGSDNVVALPRRRG